MRKDTPFWNDVPLCEPENLASFDRIKFDSIFPMLQRMIPLSTSARWHLLDAIRYDQFGKIRTIDKPYRSMRSLDKCTFYETRRFGCNTDETSKEIVDSGLVSFDVPLHLIERKFTKNDLTEILLNKGISFKKSQKKKELMALVKEHSINDLLELSYQRKYFLLTNELEAKGEILREFFYHQANRLGFWAAGTLVPRIRDILKKG